ncbi:MAG: type II secretion system F family protein, partial [Planctomycetota bacterium]
FPGVYRASVEAGEASGALDLVLGRLGGYLEWTQSMRSTTVQALIYPMILCFAILGLILILLYFVLPRIMGIFPGGPEDLPAQTRFVLAASDFLRANGLVLLGVGIASAISFAVSFRTPGGKRFFHGLLLRVPKLGMVLAKIATSRFASTASTLQAAGCDVFKVLRIAGATCGNAAMAAGFERATERVRNGQTIADALEDARGVDPLLIQMVAVGEKTGRLDDCLNRVVEYYDQEVPRAVKRFISILEPLLLVVAGGVVAFILLAALMPIFKLYESL